MPEESSSSSSSSAPVYATLDAIIGESYPQGVDPDLSFTSADLAGGHLLLRGVKPGGFVVTSPSGLVANAVQKEVMEHETVDGQDVLVCAGTDVDMTPFMTGQALPAGTWKVRFIRGPRGPAGQATNDVAPSDDVLLYALIFG